MQLNSQSVSKACHVFKYLITKDIEQGARRESSGSSMNCGTGYEARLLAFGCEEYEKWNVLGKAIQAIWGYEADFCRCAIVRWSTEGDRRPVIDARCNGLGPLTMS
jgi:hypothetical protein